MPKVQRKTKNRAGAERKCGACGETIQPGQEYLSWSFRYGGTYYRCLQHPPKRSDLTQSKMGDVYSAIENAEEQIASAESIEDIRSIIEEVAEATRSVAEEYEEAAEPFGNQGENQERADELNSWADELESFDPEEPEEAEFDEEEAEGQAREMVEADSDLTFADAMQQLRDEWESEHEYDESDAAREEASICHLLGVDRNRLTEEIQRANARARYQELLEQSSSDEDALIQFAREFGLAPSFAAELVAS